MLGFLSFLVAVFLLWCACAVVAGLMNVLFAAIATTDGQKGLWQLSYGFGGLALVGIVYLVTLEMAKTS